MTGGGPEDSVAAVRRWLTAGRDVVVRGERGSGKSTTLEKLRAELSDRRLPGVLLRASGPAPFAAVLDHPSVPTRAGGQGGPPRPLDETALAAWLSDELAQPRSVLLVDDADRLDPGSLRVVQRALVRSRCRLVASTTTDLLHLPPGSARELLVTRAPAEVRVQPLGLAALAALVTRVLEGPADAALTATLLMQSGGNPGAAVALLASARATGALRQEDGRHVDAGGLVDAPAEALTALFLGSTDPQRVEALERLAVVGPLSADAAAELVDPALLDDLAEQGRLIELDARGRGSVLAVSPPALARALRDRVSAPRRRLVRAARDLVGDVITTADPRPADLAALLARDTTGTTDYLRWSTQMAGVVQERQAAAEAAAQAAWVAAPSLRTANLYLGLLMRRPAREQIATVFRDTSPGPADTTDDVVAFRYFRTRWETWYGSDGAAEGDSAGDLGRLELDDLRDLATLPGDERPAEEVFADEPVPDVPQRFRGGPELLRAAALLEAGRPDLALTICEDERHAAAERGGPPVQEEIRQYLAAIQGECLSMLGRLDEAERHERALLSEAYDAYDGFGIRVHAAVLSEVLAFAGEREGAWRVLSTALRLGPVGPIETTFYRRGLSLGAILQAEVGNFDLAQGLLRELAKTPKVYRPLLRSLRVIGGIAVAVSLGDRASAAEIAWQAGQAYAAAGLRQPALLAWAFCPPPLTRERAATVREVREGAVLPLLDPYLDLQLALAEGDEEAAAAALPRVEPTAARTLTAAARELLGLDGGPDLPGAPVATAADEPLTDREREVAALGREGLSNRDIAVRLGLSVRTVENHMSRALHKLGYRSRGQLGTWAEQ